MKRVVILTCCIVGVIFTSILTGYVNDQRALDTETKLKQTKIRVMMKQFSLKDIMRFLMHRANCDLSFQTQDDGGQAEIVPVTNRTQDIYISSVFKTNNDLYVEQIAVSNAPVFDIIDTVVKKAGLKWRISGTGVVIIMPTNSIYLSIKKDYEQQKKDYERQKELEEDFEEHRGRPKFLSADHIKSYVYTNDYISIVSDTNNYYVLASYWIEKLRDGREVYQGFVDEMGVETLQYSIYIVPASLPSSINEMFNGPDADASALRVSPRGVVGSPVWDRLGERIAYVRVSEDKKEGNIVILNVNNGREAVYSGLGIRPVSTYWPEISWDESGRLIAFVDEKNRICRLDLKDQTYRYECLCGSWTKAVSLSPDGNYVCFMEQSWLANKFTNIDSLTISYQEQNVQEPEGSSPVVCVKTNIGVIEKWTMYIENIQDGKTESISSGKYNIGILFPPLLWMPDSKSIVIRTLAPDEKGNCVPSYYSYLVTENKLVPYSGEQKLPYSQFHRYWGVKE